MVIMLLRKLIDNAIDKIYTCVLTMTNTVEGSTGDKVATSLWFTLAATKMRALSMPKISYLNFLFNNLHEFVIFLKFFCFSLSVLSQEGDNSNHQVVCAWQIP